MIDLEQTIAMTILQAPALVDRVARLAQAGNNTLHESILMTTRPCQIRELMFVVARPMPNPQLNHAQTPDPILARPTSSLISLR
jgi:hypothetical protein